MTRIASGAALIALVVGAIWFLPPLALLILAEIVLLLAFLEYASLTDKLGMRIPRFAAATATGATCAAVGWGGVPVEGVLMTTTVALAAVALGSGRGGLDALHAVAASTFAQLYLGLSLGALVAIRVMHGRQVVLLLVATIAVSDIAQYYSGRFFGRRPLAPRISPKKTVEGAIGGFVAGGIVLAWLGGSWLAHVALPWRIVLGAALVALGIAGDLFESLLKRAAGEKDSSHLIPGHGGVLDRIDALLFAAPDYYVIVRYAA